MSREPKGNKGMQRKLLHQALSTNREMKRAMIAASQALDRQNEELIALKRILISERAQVIFYSDKYLACLRKECLDLAAQDFLKLPEDQQEVFVIQAIKELSAAHGLVPRGDEDAQAADEAATVAKKLILPN